MARLRILLIGPADEGEREIEASSCWSYDEAWGPNDTLPKILLRFLRWFAEDVDMMYDGFFDPVVIVILLGRYGRNWTEYR